MTPEGSTHVDTAFTGTTSSFSGTADGKVAAVAVGSQRVFAPASWAGRLVTGTAVITGSVFVWLGMVLAISFIEAPLKFRAPDVTVRIGLGIGRIVFRALNAVEAVLAVVVIAALVLADVPGSVLVAQFAAVRPVLNRRSDHVLAGETPPRSRAHLVYIATEVVKVIALATSGVLALSAL